MPWQDKDYYMVFAALWT